MQYRVNPKNSDKLSALGYGCMRYTKHGGQIDQKKAEREMAAAIKRGVNYFDTAYIYNGCEVCLGKFLKKYDLRKKINIATKLPQYYIKAPGDPEKYFAEQLLRLQTDYVDYYLLHMLNDVKSFQRLCDLGLLDWIAQKKESGQIRNIGFSFHGGTIAFKKLIDAYDWDFCQIQFNYLDEHSQAGIEGLNYAGERNIPVIIMEPLRGGRLANNLPKSAKAVFKRANPDRTYAEWGLRWVLNHKYVSVVLSGMNDISQVKENCRLVEDALPDHLKPRELAVYKRVLKEIHKTMKVGCTGCGYCQPCSVGVDIPSCFAAYNNSFSDGYAVGFKEYMMTTTLRKDRSNAGLCVKCGKCEKQCPQKIKIRSRLGDVRRRFEHPVFKIAARCMKFILRY